MNTRNLHKLLMLFVLLSLGCSQIPKNFGSNGPAPGQMDCKSPSDPSCVGQAGAMVQIPLGTGTIKALKGQCELFVEDQDSPKPCEGVRLVFRSSREGQERAATVKGFNFRIEDLVEDTYKVQASSSVYQLETEGRTTVTNPSGQNVKIRVRAKPRP